MVCNRNVRSSRYSGLFAWIYKSIIVLMLSFENVTFVNPLIGYFVLSSSRHWGSFVDLSIIMSITLLRNEIYMIIMHINATKQKKRKGKKAKIRSEKFSYCGKCSIKRISVLRFTINSKKYPLYSVDYYQRAI